MAINPVGVCPVLHVSNLTESLKYYTEVFGAVEEFTWEGFYAGIMLGERKLHLSMGCGAFNRPVGGANIYFILESPAAVDAAYAQIVAAGGKTDKEPQNYPYGMRDFVAFDLDQNMLTFGADCEAA
jgi:uncharacterized glyoxalase superfamily protein PhnB